MGRVFRVCSRFVHMKTQHVLVLAASVLFLSLFRAGWSMCIPLPRNFNIGCCANEKLLRLIAHRRVRFFTFMFVSTLVLGAGGDSLNLIQALESIVIPETYECTSSVSTWYRKTVYDLRFWHDDVWRESRASLVEEWNFMLDIRLGCASICKRVVGHIHWEFFFWAPQHFFSFWTVCVSFDRGHF